MDVWADKVNRYGVLYPMQTFSKQRVVDFQHIPIFVESNSEADTRFLKAVASVLSKQVYEATSEQRKNLHYDENVINNHLQMLSDEPEMQELYRLISESIHRQNS